MAGKRTFVFLSVNFLLLVPDSSTIDTANYQIQKQCPTFARFDLREEIPDEFGVIVKFGRVFPPETIWREDGVTFGCDFKMKKPLLPLCCPLGTMKKDGSCIEEQTSVSLPSVYSTNLTTDGVEANADTFDMIASDPCGSDGNGWVLEPEIYGPSHDWYLMRNGSLYLPNLINGSSTMLHIDSYCFYSEENSTRYIPKLCSIPEVYRSKIIAMLISVPFLVATFVVYMIIPELRNLHGLTVSAFVASLTVGFTTFGMHYFVEEPSEKYCLFTAFTINFSILASFFWLNVMCFDIWLTFGGLSSLPGSVKPRHRKQFFIYSIYAWGCAILLTGICAIMDLPGIPETLIRPEFGVERCWYATKAAKALYFYGPLGIIIICNIILFISTAAKILKHKKDTKKHLKGRDSKRHDSNEQWFNLYLKLFIVMGINWSIEIISWLWQGPQLIWLLLDIANSLQGVIIFIIFVCKRKIIRLLTKRFGCREENSLS